MLVKSSLIFALFTTTISGDFVLKTKSKQNRHVYIRSEKNKRNEEELTTQQTLLTTLNPTTIVEETLCPNITKNIIKDERRIQLFRDPRDNWCAKKKYTGYNEGDEIWYSPCQADSSTNSVAQKFKWSRFASESDVNDTFSIKSRGAKVFKGIDLCWSVEDPISNSEKKKKRGFRLINDQRLVLASCNESLDNQKFLEIEGRIHVYSNTNLCVGFATGFVEDDGVALGVSKCFANSFDFETGCDNGDDTIRPVLGNEEESLCWFKKFLGYKSGHDIFVKNCGVTDQNRYKSGKYRKELKRAENEYF